MLYSQSTDFAEIVDFKYKKQSTAGGFLSESCALYLLSLFSIRETGFHPFLKLDYSQ